MRKILLLTKLLIACASFAQVPAGYEMYLGPSDGLKQGEATYYLVEVMPATSLAQLAGGNIEVLRQVGSQYYIIRPQRDEPFNTNQEFIKNIWPANDRWKIVSPISQSGIDQFYVRCSNFTRLSADDQITILSKKGDVALIRCNSKYLSGEVVTWEEVFNISQESIAVKAESPVIDMNLNPNKINVLHHQYPALNGEGITISIQEQKFASNDLDLIGREVPSNLASTEIDNHATEMATIAAGAGNSYVTGKGVAWGALLTSSDFVDVLPDTDADYNALQVSVQNHSYGTQIEDFYGIQANAFDVSANQNPVLLHVFSSGNQGQATPSEGLYAGNEGYANLTGNFKMSKNTLVIGSVDTVGRDISFASRGPAYDGRIKPELVSYSAVGSSNSAALVSGVVAILQQRYQELTDTLPPSDLMKALLINSAEDVGNKHVDFINGFGNMNAWSALQGLDQGWYFRDTLVNLETVSHVISLPPGAQNFKITLVWNDPAAEPGTSKALVNDLDLKVIDGNMETWLPWVPNSSSGSLDQIAARREDHLNNIEQVTLENPGESLTIEISGVDISTELQAFSIAYQWDMPNRFNWTYPSGSDNFPYNGETATYFRWESTLDALEGQLELSLDSGDSWQTLEIVDLSTGYFRWEAPEDLMAIGLARMNVGGESYTTEYFTISQAPRLEVGFICDDSLLIEWESLEEVDNYSVFAYDAPMFEEIGQTADTAFLTGNADLQQTFLSVQPFLNGKPTLRSFALDYTKQGVSCYISTFFAIKESDGIDIQLQVGTIYGIAAIQYTRLNQDGTETLIADISDLDSTLVISRDLDPEEGLNRYRADIQLVNGNTIQSEVAEAFFLREIPYQVFPNPIEAGTQISVFSKDFTGFVGLFSLYNSNGQLQHWQELRPEIDFIDTTDLEAGLYLYTIQRQGEIFKGKIIVK